MNEPLPTLEALIAPARAPVLRRVLAASPFVTQVFASQRDWAAAALAGDAFAAAPETAVRLRLSAALAGCQEESAWMRELRGFRNREFASIAFREIAGDAAPDETLQALSDFADAALTATIERAETELCAGLGTPRAVNGSVVRVIVLGMGKLGGGELNFSSDIDLIFAYTAAGQTDGRTALSNQEFFARLVQQVVRLLAQRTADGFVFRVDTLLRPFGSAGALALAVEAMETYYQNHGREWERYALLKARPVAGDLDAGRGLLAALRPFVYRRYLDFNALGALRDLKQRIDEAAARQGAGDDLKLGPGGIRELEFVVQLFQLTRGGQDVRLRDPRLRTVLRRLGDSGQLTATTAIALDDAYLYLRRCENAIQIYADQQTHRLPQSEPVRAALCAAMRETDWPSLMARLELHRERVRSEFERLFSEPAAETRSSQTQARQLWEADASRLEELLRELGFRQRPQDAAAAIEALRSARLVRTLDEPAQHRLSRITGLLAEEAAKQPSGEIALARALQVVGALAGRGTYLSLLRDSATTRAQLIRLVAASPWIADLLAQTPALLDALLDVRLSAEAPHREALSEELAARAAGIADDPHDVEGPMELLRRYRQEMTLRIAAADLAGTLPLVQVSDRLTWLAEAIVAQALRFARAQLVAQFGELPGSARFAVIAYGKFGSIELGYGSDLDLVFVYDSDAADATTRGPTSGPTSSLGRSLGANDFFARLAQRCIGLLTTLTGAGRAYEVDLQLRPSGNSGLVVTSFAGFARYQREAAWTWEHQALLRARTVAGDPSLCSDVDALRREVLTRPREPAALRREVREMRAKMRASAKPSAAGRWDVKQGRGGLIDAEFITQFLCLRDAPGDPSVVHFTDNWRQLEALANAGRMNAGDKDTLLAAERAYRGYLHRRALQQQDASADEAQFADERAAVAALWTPLLEEA